MTLTMPTHDHAAAALRERLAGFFSEAPAALADRPEEEVHAAIEELLGGLEDGTIRAATPSAGPDTDWTVHGWVKRGILTAFARSAVTQVPGGIDKALVPARALTPADGVRLVPGGSAVRRGAHLAASVVVMPPSYVNVGAFVDAGTMLDSHVLVGSCAQIGGGVHLSAGVQVGGVLEPIGARPVVVEDGAFVGAQCGLFEGAHVGRDAVLAPGVTLTSRTVLLDLVDEREVTGAVPAGAVVVPGSRPARGDWARERGIQTYAPVIVKYRDTGTDAATVLEEALR